MNAIQDHYHQQIQDHFDKIFKRIVSKEICSKKWPQTDIVFRNGKRSTSFEDVEFLMASDASGGSFLYSSQGQGNGLYSVIQGEVRVSFRR